MANTKSTDDIKVEFVRTDKAGSPGKYDAHVQTLIKADAARTDKQIADNQHASVVVTFPKEENGKPAVERYKRYFRASAAAHDLSASIQDETDNGDTVAIRWTVRPRITRPRKAKEPEFVPDTASSDEPVSEAA